ncbi:hypothetical protein ACFFX0_27810 [Citricoccus parietis]|uniref:Uncharacterized protein n=1 Tax=Citricoccus parietis TaxID=592307 RepID=A0ABV5G792_9MICC
MRTRQVPTGTGKRGPPRRVGLLDDVRARRHPAGGPGLTGAVT